MPNWCFTSYVFEGKKEEIADLHKKLQSLTEIPTPLVENDFGKLWLGCVVTLFGGDWNVIYCRGSIDDMEEPEETTLNLRTITAWVDMPKVWDFVLKQYPSVKYYFCTEEPGNCYYSTNDKEGKFFPDRFIVEQDGVDIKYHSNKSDLFEDIANRTSVSITSRKEMDNVIKQYNKTHEDEKIYVNAYTVIQQNKKRKTKRIEINGVKYTFLRYKDEWVFPVFDIHESGLESPVALILYYISYGVIARYTDVTTNLPECKHCAGCQFIDTNNNDADIVDWLEENKFGVRTGNKGKSGFRTYPEFNFYKGKKYWKYRNLPQETINNLIY